MKRYLIALTFLVLFSFISTIISSKTYACSCGFQPDPHKALEESKAVFSGKVLEIKLQVIDVDGILESKKAVLFDVDQTWKGISQTQVLVNTNFGESSCGNEFKVGQTYLVFASNNDNNKNTIQTSTCSLTKEFSNSNLELNKIGQGVKPIENVNLKDTMNKMEYSNKLAYVKMVYHRLVKYHLTQVILVALIVVIGILVIKKRSNS
ncbi:hypothetical protein QFZ81_002958 [Paenibacillus sp. V4I9]|uniref:hypothetical protein n=1 Tax=Paenibacillus sp. V4I9 TaxID=3042308 RepID=UPI0027848027|nr:hypothetical protein [Paenibacillus sp. V4I9]MDQ0887870.1 hypothetical protein [Paenibacillus sp. V4I9]